MKVHTHMVVFNNLVNLSLESATVPTNMKSALIKKTSFDSNELVNYLACLGCLRRRTRSITNERSPGCSILRCCHGIAQGQLGVIDDLVGPAEWWTSSWAVPC